MASLTTKNQIDTSTKPTKLATKLFPFTVMTVLKVPSDTSRIRTKFYEFCLDIV